MFRFYYVIEYSIYYYVGTYMCRFVCSDIAICHIRLYCACLHYFVLQHIVLYDVA